LTLCPFYRDYRASSYASAVLELKVVILTVCPSVCLSHACSETKSNKALQIFWYHTKRQSL